MTFEDDKVKNILTKTMVLFATVCLLPIESNSGEMSWSLVWSDEFDGEALDLNKWEALFDVSGGGNNELQFYTKREKNVRLEDGVLNIEAHNQPFTGIDSRNGKEKTRQYTSARIRTKNKGDWKYCRIEARAKMPKGQGYWPAIWMMPTDSVYGGWAASGEIDIMEYLGQKTDEVHGTLHYGASWPQNTSSGKPFTLQTGNFSDERFHLILNLAVGGNWPGAPDDETVFPQSLQVDYVRVYQKNAEVETSNTH